MILLSNTEKPRQVYFGDLAIMDRKWKDTDSLYMYTYNTFYLFINM